jgi:hypothetical protein
MCVPCHYLPIAGVLTKVRSLDRKGNRTLIVICLVNMLVLYPGTRAYYVWRNRQRAKVWDAMTTEVWWICHPLSA